MSLCMANGKFFGSGMCIAPTASLNDKLLELIIIGDVSIIDYLKNLSRVKKGLKIEHKEVFYETVKSCKIKSLEKTECPIDMDGEFIGFTPIEVKLHSKSIFFFSDFSLDFI